MQEKSKQKRIKMQKKKSKERERETTLPIAIYQIVILIQRAIDKRIKEEKGTYSVL